MMDGDVPDSTDWLSTPLTGLAAVENALRCEVCKDFYKTPMITSCCHTFCSLCIRRALGNDGKCPLCRASDQEMKLRSNWSMEETVDAFVKVRTATLELARRKDKVDAGPKRKANASTNDEKDVPEGKRLRTSARLRKNKTETLPVDSDASEDEEEVQEVVEVPDDDYEPEPEDGLVPCPVCQRRMKEWQVFSHLESCTGPSPPKRKPEIKPFGQLQRQQSKSLDRLPAINYSMMKEQALRKKLADVGIPNQGPRALLERRHKEWMTIWNANCDATNPKKRNELLQDLEMWERTQGGRAPTTGRAAQNAAIIKDKNFDGEAWASKHDASFKDLIASARKSREEARKKMEDAKEEARKEAEEKARKQSSSKEASSHPNPSKPDALEGTKVQLPGGPTTAQPNHFSQGQHPQPAASSSNWSPYQQTQQPPSQMPYHQPILPKPQPSSSSVSQHQAPPWDSREGNYSLPKLGIPEEDNAEYIGCIVTPRRNNNINQ